MIMPISSPHWTINNLACGVVKCYLFYDSSITITLPTEMPFLNIGDFLERVDADPTVVDVENVQLDIAEDYSTYAEGFWWRLINGYPKLDVQIMFTIMEGNDEVFHFRGSVFRDNTTFGEPYIVVSDKERTLSAQFASMLTPLDNVATSSLIVVGGPDGQPVVPATEIAESYGSGNIAWMVKFADLFKTMFALAYGGAVTDFAFTNNSADFMGATSLAPTTWINWTDMYFVGLIQLDLATGSYLDPTDVNGWAQNYGKASDLLKYLCSLFGCTASYSYGNSSGIIDPISANNKHRISFNSRGNAGANTYVTPAGKIIKSDVVANSPIQAQNIRVTLASDSTQSHSWINGVLYLSSYGVPSNVAFDIDLSTTFKVAIHPTSFEDRMRTLYGSAVYPGSDTGHQIDNLKYWKYQAGSTGYVTTPITWMEAIGDYNHYRFLPNRLQCTRIYGSLKATLGGVTSIRNLKNLAGHQITDVIAGVSVTNNFYATQTKKNITTNQIEVVWLQE